MAPLSLGSPAPDFALPGIDGATHSLDEHRDAAVLVIFWSCNHCPYVQAYEDRLMALQSDLAERGVHLVAINSNSTQTHPQDSFEKMKERAAERGFNYQYLRDEDQSVARAYGAQRTPEVFVFDGERRLRYRGGIDDSWDNPRGVSRSPLRDAVEALLAGGEPPIEETPPVGCTVKWHPEGT